jgi:hypothetical protein
MTTQADDIRLIPLYNIARQVWAAQLEVDVQVNHSFCGVYTHGLPLMVIPIGYGITERMAIRALEAALRELAAYR